MELIYLVLFFTATTFADVTNERLHDQGQYYSVPIAFFGGINNQPVVGIDHEDESQRNSFEDGEADVVHPRLFFKKKFLLLKKLLTDKPTVITIPQPIPIPIPIPRPPFFPPTGTGTGTGTGIDPGTGTEITGTGTATAIDNDFRTQNYEYYDDENDAILEGTSLRPDGSDNSTENKLRRKINRKPMDNSALENFQQFFPQYNNPNRRKINKKPKNPQRPNYQSIRQQFGNRNGNRRGSNIVKYNKKRVIQRPLYILSQE